MGVILPPEADQRRSEIPPLSASETLTQRRMRRIGAGSPHANGSVKEASDTASAARLRNSHRLSFHTEAGTSMQRAVSHHGKRGGATTTKGNF